MSPTPHAKPIIIAVDGFSSCGKSTFAKAIAAHMGYRFIDTGAMYRGVTLFGMERGAVTADGVASEALVALLDEIHMSFRYNPQRGASDLYVGGVNVEQQIRTIEVSQWVSEVSSIAAIREKLVALQQQMGEERGVVMDGRDIGTVVFPEAELKIFMTADPHVRAERRYKELIAKGEEVSLEEVLQNLNQRDDADQNRSISPLRPAPDAIILDNSEMTPSEQMEWIMGIIRERTAINP